MTDPRDPLTMTEKLIYGHDAVRDPISGRVFEQGLHAESKEVQAAAFAKEAARDGDMPRHGECAPDGRAYETGAGCLTKSAQRASWARAADPVQARTEDARAAATEAATEVQRLASVETDALKNMTAAGNG